MGGKDTYMKLSKKKINEIFEEIQKIEKGFEF